MDLRPEFELEQVLEILSAGVATAGRAPTIQEMPRRTLVDKGANGPTAAHVIEEVHTPLNYAYIS